MGGTPDFFGPARQKAEAQNNLRQQVGQFQQQARDTAGNIQTDFNRFVPTLQTDFRARPGLDQFSQGLLSASRQQANQGLANTQGQIARTVRGPQAAILNAQASAQSRLNSNPALFAIGAQQVGRQQQEAQLGNQALLAQQGAQNTAQTAGNQAQGFRLGINQLPVAAQQNLMSTLKSDNSK